jgi:hypothetical protein
MDYGKLDCLAFNSGRFHLLASAAVLSPLRGRGAVEKGAGDLMSHVGIGRALASGQAATGDMMLRALIALVAASEIGVKLEKLKVRKPWSKDT